jgi:nitroreductase/NAD-dependent dihydropyrimidine dehydrogenase PreA subunit
MSVIVVDQEKCKRDGFCVAECPISIIEMKTKESFPAPVPGAEEFCIDCGHCVAVCPHGALTQRVMSPDRCQPVDKSLTISADQADYFLRQRRSVRVYKERAVDRATLEKIIDVARYAPSSHNSQPVHWLALEKREHLDRIVGLVIDWMRVMIKDHPEVAEPMHFDRVVAAWERGLDRVLRGAPHLLVAHGDASSPRTATCCCIALTYLELAASALGLGACWAGYFNAAANFYPPLKQELALPEGHGTFGAMMVGYAKFAYHRIPLRNEARVTWRS